MATEDQLDTSAIALIGFVGAIVVFAVIILLMVVFYQVQARQQYEKDTSEPYAQVTKVTADQQGRLRSYGWVDQQRGVAHIPIERAEDLVLEELSRDPKADVTGVSTRRALPAKSAEIPKSSTPADGPPPEQNGAGPRRKEDAAAGKAASGVEESSADREKGRQNNDDREEEPHAN